MAEIGTATVKVVADVSGIEPAVRAELDRIAGMFADVGRDEVTAALQDAAPWLSIPPEVADALLERFTIRRKPPEIESGDGADAS